MAAGTTHVSAQFVGNMTLTGMASLWASDTVKMALITNAITPSITDPDPRWGAGGSTNYSTAEVTGGSYVAGGFTLAGTTSTLVGATVSLNATSPVNLAANAGNPANAYWAIFYDSTDAGKHVFGFMDLAGPLSLVPGWVLWFNNQPTGAQPVLQGTAT